jgi:MFS family permease
MMMPLVAIIFAGFLCIGLPLPTLPLQVHGVLGFSPLIVGCVVGIQSFATILTRKFAGTYADKHGAKHAVLLGLPLASLSGLTYVVSALIPHAGLSLAVLIVGRLLMGPAESLFLTGAMTWGIGRIGPHRTGVVMSWQGIAMFSALGAGAPLGIAAMHYVGFIGVGIITIVLPMIGMAIALRLANVAPIVSKRERVPFMQVIGLISRQGAALSLATVPYAVLNSFVVLFFASKGWDGAGLALTGFALGYIVVRIFLGKLPDRLGGREVAAVSVVIEAVGQLLLWLAPTPMLALAGATLTGVGFSLVFPSMGVEAMRRVPPEVRGVAVGGFFAFVDVTSGITGPVIGVLIGALGYQSAFLAGMCVCLLSFLMVMFGMGQAAARKA